MDPLLQDLYNSPFVRLQNRGRGGYLFAKKDGRRVCVSSNEYRHPTYNSVWGVQTLETESGLCVLLRSAAYGRYLTATRVLARAGQRGFDVVQGTRDQSVMWPFMWQGTVATGAVVLHCASEGPRRYLRANGWYRRWHKSVTIEAVDDPTTMLTISTMMQWIVEVVPLSLKEERPENPYEQPLGPSRLPEVRGRQIQYVVADDDGNIDEGGWTTISFDGRSFSALATNLARRMGEGVDVGDITVCARAGRHGRLTPLLTDLPCSNDRMDVVVIVNDTPAYNEVRFADIDGCRGERGWNIRASPVAVCTYW